MEKWTDLSESMKKERGIYYEIRLDPRLLAVLACEGSAVTREEGGRIVAYIARLESLDPKVQEIGLAWVALEWRKRGLLRAIMPRILASTPPGIDLHSISKNPGYIKVACDQGFYPVTLENKPDLLEWAHRVGIGLTDTGRLPHTAVRPANREMGQRWLLFRPAR